MPTIYFDNRILTVCSQSNINNDNPNIVKYSLSKESQLSSIPLFYENAPQIKHLQIPVNDQNIEQSFKILCSPFRHINAGGGLVFNQKGEVLLINRKGLWDLPKGKQEPNEDIRDAALREVEEECGISGVELQELICITHHCYRHKGNFMLKHTYWYKMIYNHSQECTPQTEEEIKECVWVNPKHLTHYLNNTYLSILEVFTASSLSQQFDMPQQYLQF